MTTRLRCYSCRKKIDSKGIRCLACEAELMRKPKKKTKIFKESRWVLNPVNGFKYQAKPIKEKTL